jgi:hypothetical protein
LFSITCALFCNFLHFFARLPHRRPFAFNELRTLLLFLGGGERVPRLRWMSSRTEERDLLFSYSHPLSPSLYPLSPLESALTVNAAFRRVLAEIVRPQPLYNPHFHEVRP